jgi:protein phosphatase
MGLTSVFRGLCEPNAMKETVIIDKPMLEAFGVSDPGCVRANNEDYYLLAPNLGLYVVADGMGGARAGEHASKLAADTVWEVVQDSDNRSPETLLHAFQEANRRVFDAASTNPRFEGMGTTLVAALECPEGVLIASVGDSRAYLFDDGHLIVLTEDQTWVHEVGRRLNIDEEILKTHPMRHVLTMAIGVSSELRVHTYSIKTSPGMLLLICSDGLHGVVDEDTIAQSLSHNGDLKSKCDSLVEAARSAGGPDNITAVLIEARNGNSPPKR